MLPHKLSLLILTRPRRLLQSGFTLIEVLISVIISGLIVTGLLYLVVEALQLDRREVVLNQVQGDMRRALDYISTDLREAVYVYTPDNAETQLLGNNGLSAGDRPDGQLVLALWRLEPIDDGDTLPVCEGQGAVPEDRRDECRVLRIRQAYYNLVMYFQVDNDDDSIWEGSSRIIRYSLPHYTRGNISSLTRTPGFNDPTRQGVQFEGWTRKSDEDTQGLRAVLVDNLAPLSPLQAGGDDADSFCENETGSSDYIATGVSADSSFIACVTNPNITQQTRTNQEVFLSIIGDASTGRELINPFSDASRFPPVKARVLVRGVLEKPAPVQ